MTDQSGDDFEMNATIAEQSAGGIIQAARENLGLSVEHLASVIKVSTKKIVALEQNRWNDIGDAVFVRALGSSVAKYLKIDPQLILSKMPISEDRIRFSDNLVSSVSSYISRESDFSEKPKSNYPIYVGLLIALSVAMFFIPDAYLSKEQWNDWFGSTTEPTSNVSQDMDVMKPAPISAESQPPMVPPVPAPTEGLQASPPSSEQKTAPQSLPSASASPVVPVLSSPEPMPMPMPVAAVPATNKEALVITAIEDSWIEVTDAQGKTRIQKLLVKNESVEFSGGLPYSVVLGRADRVHVMFQGKKFDAVAISKNNVARFQLK